MTLFDALGFHWDRTAIPASVFTHSLERVLFRFNKMLPEFVWDASTLEENPFSYPQVQTLMDGVTVVGQKISDQEQILNLAESAKRLLAMVKDERFALAKPAFIELNGIVARNESLEWGLFRGEGDEKNYTPDEGLGTLGVSRIVAKYLYSPMKTLPNAPELNRAFQEGVTALKECEPFERALAFYVFGAYRQFFFDGNKRTSRLMMNGVLMSHGIDAISVPAAKAAEFNGAMLCFYESKDATQIMTFLANCHPDARQIYEQHETEHINNSCGRAP